jgi:hypothetical protein
MWVCRNHPFGVHHLHDEIGVLPAAVVTVPLDGYMACDCTAFHDAQVRLKSRANEFQVTCRHVAQVSAMHCGYRSDHSGPCRMCGKDMVRIEDVIPGWIGKDRNSLLDDLLRMRKELHGPTE